MTDEQKALNPPPMVTLGDLLRSKNPPSVAELATRIERDGVLGWDRFQRLRRHLFGSRGGDFAMNLLAEYANYLACPHGIEDPLWMLEGEPDDPYNSYGWTPEELDKSIDGVHEASMTLVGPRLKLTEKQLFDRQMDPVLERLKSLLAEDGFEWNAGEFLPGTVHELYEFVGWVDPSIKRSDTSDNFRKKCHGLVKFKKGAPRKEDVDDKGNLIEQAISPLGRLLERNGLRSQKDLEPSAARHR